MAISVDTVYQTVLALANKEQRGYITPQEFNLFANQAQMEIFEQYFYDLGQFKRVLSNDDAISDVESILQEKIDLFEASQTLDDQNPQQPDTHDSLYPADHYRTIAMFARTDAGGNAGIQKLTRKEYQLAANSPLLKPTVDRPVYMNDWQNNRFIVVPNLITNSNFVSKVELYYIRKPKNPKWSYVIINEKALWNPDAADKQDFELHESEHSNLVIRILKLAGVSIKDYNLAQAANQEEVKTIQQQKS